MNRPEPLFTQETNTEDRILNRIPLELIMLAVVLSIPGAFLLDLEIAGLFFLGGIFSALNFYMLKKEISKALLSKKRKAVKSLLGFYGIRLILIVGVFFVIIIFFSKKALAFAGGFSLIVPVFLVEAVIGLSKLKSWKN